MASYSRVTHSVWSRGVYDVGDSPMMQPAAAAASKQSKGQGTQQHANALGHAKASGPPRKPEQNVPTVEPWPSRRAAGPKRVDSNPDLICHLDVATCNKPTTLGSVTSPHAGRPPFRSRASPAARTTPQQADDAGGPRSPVSYTMLPTRQPTQTSLVMDVANADITPSKPSPNIPPSCR